MSIILKALQKSQHERELQAPEAPPLRQDFGDPEPGGRAWWPWSLAALALVALVLAGALLWPAGEALLARFLAERSEASQTAEAPEALPASPAEPTVEPPARPVAQVPPQPVAQERGQPAPAAMPEVAAGPEVATGPEVAAEPETTLPGGSRLDQEAPPAAAPVTAATPETVQAAPAAAPTAAPKDAPEPVSVPAPALGSEPHPDPISEPGSETVAATPLEGPLEAPVEASRQAAIEEPPVVVATLLPRRKPDVPPPLPAPEAVRTRPLVVVPDEAPGDAEADRETPDPGRRAAAGVTNLTILPAVPSLRDLPVAFQDSLPKIHISIHIYDSEPGNRMVRINRRKVREGGHTEDGLRVDEITPGGLILTYKDTQFRYPIQ